MPKRSNWLYTPFFIVILPVIIVLQLYTTNITEVSAGVIIRPILVLLILTLLFFLLFIWITRDIQKSSLLTFGLLVLMLYYGLCYQYLKTHPVLGFNLGRHSILGVAFIIIALAFLIFLLLKRTRVNQNVSLFFNIVAVFLVVTAFVKILSARAVYSAVQTRNETSSNAEAQEKWIQQAAQPLKASDGQQMPDIYYIIPDMFGRSDAIQTETGWDSSKFTQQLSDLGFYVVNCSRSNYASTQLSITSELNLQYLDKIQNGLPDRGSLIEPMNDSLLRHSLESLGYKTVVFENGFGLPEMYNADVSLSPQKKFLLFQPYDPFENLIVSNSFLRIFYDVKLGPLSRLYDHVFFPYWDHVNTQKYILDELPNLQNIEGPKFVFAHIMMPHPPYLVHADGTVETDSRYYREALGQPVTEALYLQGYEMQTQYLENRLPQIVAQIIKESKVPPVIVIQGDHGIRYSNRLENFSAIYAPASVKANLYPTMSSVNTWRVVLNGLFGSNYPMLNDVSYYSVYPDWFDMQVEAEQAPACVNVK